MPTRNKKLLLPYGPEAEAAAVAREIHQAKVALSARIAIALTEQKPQSWAKRGRLPVRHSG
jgi:hypothetical protein